MDDDEQAYLKVMMDEIFGRKNFINNIIWQKNTLHKMIQRGFQTIMTL
nr:hypothetical protein [Bartonella taylorii]